MRLCAWLLEDENLAAHLRSLKTSTAFAERVLAIAACRLPADADKPALRRAIHRYGGGAVLDRARIEALASGEDRILTAAADLLEAEHCFAVTDLKVGGADAARFGFCGKSVGEALGRVLDAVFSEQIPNEKEAELAFLRALAEKH